MLDMFTPTAAPINPLRPSTPTASNGARRYEGPERRAATSVAWRWLAATLDELDYGLVLLAEGGRIVHVNHAARAELDESHPLQLVGHRLQARHAVDTAQLHEALRGAATRGLRKLLTLGEGTRRASLSVVPLVGPMADCAATLVILNKRQSCESLSVAAYAKGHDLTPAETRILVALCKGDGPAEIAKEVGVAISTVRTQIGSIRTKTGAESIRALLQQISLLPPLRGVLRQVGSTSAGCWPTQAEQAFFAA